MNPGSFLSELPSLSWWLSDGKFLVVDVSKIAYSMSVVIYQIANSDANVVPTRLFNIFHILLA